MLRTDFEMIIDLPITDAEKLVMLVLLRFRNGKTGQCNPSKATIGEKAGHNERWVYAVLQELKRAGHVDVVQLGGGAGRTTSYVLNLGGCATSIAATQENPVEPNTVRNPVHLDNPVGNPVHLDNRNTNRELNTRTQGEHRFPPIGTKGGTNAKTSRLDRAIANIDRVCGAE